MLGHLVPSRWIKQDSLNVNKHELWGPRCPPKCAVGFFTILPLEKFWRKEDASADKRRSGTAALKE